MFDISDFIVVRSLLLYDINQAWRVSDYSEMSIIIAYGIWLLIIIRKMNRPRGMQRGLEHFELHWGKEVEWKSNFSNPQVNEIKFTSPTFRWELEMPEN